MTPTAPLDAHLALAQRVKELEGMLALGQHFFIGNIDRRPITVKRDYVLGYGTFYGRQWIQSYETQEQAIRAAREYITANGGALA